MKTYHLLPEDVVSWEGAVQPPVGSPKPQGVGGGQERDNILETQRKKKHESHKDPRLRYEFRDDILLFSLRRLGFWWMGQLGERWRGKS